MRVAVALLALAAAVAVAAPAQAEKRIFIIANNADGYGVDRCLSKGDACGHAMAAAYCKAREFDKVLSFRKVERDDITGAIPANGHTCRGATCDEFVAIECVR